MKEAGSRTGYFIFEGSSTCRSLAVLDRVLVESDLIGEVGEDPAGIRGYLMGSWTDMKGVSSAGAMILVEIVWHRYVRLHRSEARRGEADVESRLDSFGTLEPHR